MQEAYLRVQIRNSMSCRKKALKQGSLHGWLTKKILVSWILIGT